MKRSPHWAAWTARLRALASLLLLWPGPKAVAAPPPLFAPAEATNASASAPVAGSEGWSGIQVFETPGSSAQIQAADQHLKQHIQARLEADPWVLSFKVQVSVRGGVATLEGRVDTVLAQGRAAQVAQTIPGVLSVNNQLQVVLPPRSDRMLRDEVQAYFLKQRPLAHSRIDIQVQGQHVILSGMVGSEYRKQLAQALAESVRGVQGVENELRVNRLAPRSDRDIQVDVESRLAWNPGLVDPQVSVQVHDGTVQLAGVVGTLNSKERAIEDAQVEGVKAVEAGRLTVWQQPAATVRGASSSGGTTVRGP